MWIILGCSAFVVFWGVLMLKGKWFLNRPQWQRLLSVGVVAALMFTMVWYMNEEAAKNELVWAEGAKEIEWDKTPIRVIVDPLIRRDVAEGAVNILNRGSCKLFVLVDPSPDWDVVVMTGSYGVTSPTSGLPMAGSTWRMRPRVIPISSGPSASALIRARFLIKIHDPGNITKQMLTLAHELTHVIGLEHDNDPRFITTNGAQEHDDLSKFLPHLSKTDTAALKKRYCR
jgi:hypothetical protein